MADITLTFRDDKIAEIRRAYSAAHGWRSVEEDGTRAAFMCRKLREHIRQVVQGQRTAEAYVPPTSAEDVVEEDTAP